jgi:hypothetical protein
MIIEPALSMPEPAAKPSQSQPISFIDRLTAAATD